MRFNINEMKPRLLSPDRMVTWNPAPTAGKETQNFVFAPPVWCKLTGKKPDALFQSILDAKF